jgi:16S rRNA (cytosine1402-N4)-methyltransferase
MTDPAAEEHFPHLPVLYHESINLLQPKSRGKYVDGTLGAGGHAKGILKASQPDGKLLGLELDSQALEIAKSGLSTFGKRTTLIKGSYANMTEHLNSIGWQCVDGILLDLGLSSMQLDMAERGFSFIKDAPLDMRFNESQPLTAAEIVNKWSEKDISNILREFGEEPRSKQIAAAIIAHRPLNSTQELATLVLAIYKGKRGKIHPATRAFQSLRMAVNNELENLKQGLNESVSALCNGGRLAVISFHSLEDRIVKQFFQRECHDCICPNEQPICTCGHKATLRLITKKVIIPSQEEVERNPRARSAKLRVAEKL